MRELVLDTETTGIDPKQGHRVIEIGAIELVNHVPTGQKYHVYINPEREVEQGAFEVHGLSTEFLADFPNFAGIVDQFLEFVGDATFVIHNAKFDMGFLNAELTRLGHPAMPMERAIDTLAMARRKFPGAQASLDALCRRFEINNTHRDLHGALIDADLLASVYLELIGGRQPGLELAREESSAESAAPEIRASVARPPRPHAPSADELSAHAALLEKLKDPIWNRSDSAG
ncbi:DNA polymerase III subunit epsilon [Nisaea acidiphila]|uniref:DNA polymerase III subunit epsilon n=1 Tax=Nisaea acidiphila TaxID=1862145 RepID=A0A9J7B151_9PROT|nr:DNA polymerase III subunit epsilon [Nisaea acidiphila]UUX52188.1 DNA polymerase III subunit epsilon [Nisaea acidiphila]